MRLHEHENFIHLCRLFLRNRIWCFEIAKFLSMICVFFIFSVISFANAARDPFQLIMPMAVHKNLFDYSIHSLDLVGILKAESLSKSQNDAESVIVVSDPSHRIYFLKLGDNIGSESAKISQILDNAIVLQWLVKGQVFVDRLKLMPNEQ